MAPSLTGLEVDPRELSFNLVVVEEDCGYA
jgi:hypothetical protein